jgi:hypothetical protein
MSNEIRSGLQITPLTLWVAGGLGSLLWGVLFAQNLRSQAKQDAINDSVTTLLTSQSYDRKELESVKGDVKQVQADVRGLSDRLGKVEARR